MAVKPCISIGLPVYNGEAHVRCAIDSLLAQTFQDFELIISDNASTDKTQEICLAYVNKDPRVKYFRNDSNMGVAWNFERVFELASADYFMWASHDDWWEPSYLKDCFSALSLSKAVVLAGSGCDCVDLVSSKKLFLDEGVDTAGFCSADRFKRYKTVLRDKQNINSLFYGVYRSDVLRKFLPFQRIMSGDQLLLAQLSLHGEFVTVNKVLMKKRLGGLSLDLRVIAKALNIRNPLILKFPYLMREFYLQRIILSSDALGIWDKIALSYWSCIDFFCLSLAHRFVGKVKKAVCTT